VMWRYRLGRTSTPTGSVPTRRSRLPLPHIGKDPYGCRRHVACHQSDGSEHQQSGRPAKAYRLRRAILNAAVDDEKIPANRSLKGRR
jgi:hypothetical protein